MVFFFLLPRMLLSRGGYCCVTATLHQKQERSLVRGRGADTLRVMTLQGELGEINVSLTWATCQQVVKQWKVLAVDPGNMGTPHPSPIATSSSTPRTIALGISTFSPDRQSARRDAARGPSGTTADLLRPILEWENDTALRKPDGGVRGIVGCDFFRRVVARTVAQQKATTVEAPTSIFQYVLSTKAGTDHVLQTLTDLDARLKVLSIAAIGVFDLVSQNSMLRAWCKRMWTVVQFLV